MNRRLLKKLLAWEKAMKSVQRSPEVQQREPAPPKEAARKGAQRYDNESKRGTWDKWEKENPVQYSTKSRMKAMKSSKSMMKAMKSTQSMMKAMKSAKSKTLKLGRKQLTLLTGARRSNLGEVGAAAHTPDGRKQLTLLTFKLCRWLDYKKPSPKSKSNMSLHNLDAFRRAKHIAYGHLKELDREPKDRKICKKGSEWYDYTREILNVRGDQQS